MPVCSPSLLLAARICRTMLSSSERISTGPHNPSVGCGSMWRPVSTWVNGFIYALPVCRAGLHGELQLRGEPGRYPCAPWEP